MSEAIARVQPRSAARPTLADVVRAGRHVFQAGERIDMQELAKAVGVGRTSLHRWVGTREKLISLVVASLSESAIRRADEQVPASVSGPDRVAAVIEVFLRGVAASYPLRRFLQREPEVAARVLLAMDGDVTHRIEVAIEQLLIRSVGSARRPLQPDARTVARLIVRLADAFYYADLIGTGEPDIESPIIGVRLLLRAYFTTAQ